MNETKICDKRELAARGEALYAKISKQLEDKHPGAYVAIDVESGDYFLGETIQEADQQASAKYPERIFYIARIGREAVWVHR